MRATLKIFAWLAPVLFVSAGCTVNNPQPVQTPAVVTSVPGTTTVLTPPPRNTVVVPGQVY